jgi:hypothetical protein
MSTSHMTQPRPIHCVRLSLHVPMGSTKLEMLSDGQANYSPTCYLCS